MPHRFFPPHSIPFFPSTSGRKPSARFFLPPAAPKTLAGKGSMMKLACPTLFSPRRDPTRPSRPRLRHKKNLYFRSKSALRSSPLASSYSFPPPSTSSAANGLLHIVAPPCRSRSRLSPSLIHQPLISLLRPCAALPPFSSRNSAARAPSSQPAGQRYTKMSLERRIYQSLEKMCFTLVNRHEFDSCPNLRPIYEPMGSS